MRVVLAGSSPSLMVVPRGGRDEGTYGELLPALLAPEPVEVHHTGQWFDRVSDLRRRYEHAVRNLFPDVLVLHYGFVEAQPAVVPTGLARHFQTWDRGTHPLAQAYRRSVAPPAWRALRTVQQRTAAWPTWRLSPARFAAELERVVTMTRDETGAQVLLVEPDPPGPRVEHWLPGLGARLEQHRAVLEGLVRPGVRLVRCAGDVAAHGHEAVLPDGIHRSPLGHRLLAEAVAQEVRACRAG